MVFVTIFLLTVVNANDSEDVFSDPQELDYPLLVLIGITADCRPVVLRLFSCSLVLWKSDRKPDGF